MIRSSLLSLLTLLFVYTYPTGLFAQKALDLIPQPQKMILHSGFYQLPRILPVIVSEEFAETAQLLREHPFIQDLKIERVKNNKKNPKNGLRLFKATEADKLPSNSYKLQIDAQEGLHIVASDATSALQAIYSLIQMAYLAEDPKYLPAVEISDRPRFAYRGLHLDVSRHFMPISFLKKYLSLMAIYKLNYLHWHLTDDAGWRIEIKKYPALTHVGAWRSHQLWSDWQQNGKQFVAPYSPNASGGFYTQEEVRDLVQYAAKRGISIIPEIEIGGHAAAVLAAYPQLAGHRTERTGAGTDIPQNHKSCSPGSPTLAHVWTITTLTYCM